MIDAIVARADGIPLYSEELTRTILEPGVARQVEEIPATLADSLMARLDRLSAAKEVAQRASVLGREFSYPLLAAVVGLEEAALRHGLARLDEAEILFVRGEPPQSSYTFKHALVQEAAYESLLKRTRRQLHGRVVEVLLAQFPERAAAEPEVMARHAELAGQTDEAITYYQRAGEQAQARSAHGEAIAQFRKAIALLATQPEGAQRDTHEVALQLLLGGSLIADRGFAHPEVEAPYERARVLCEAVGDAGRRLGIAQLGLANFHYNRGEVERGRALAAEVLALAEAQGSAELLVMAHQNVAEPEFYQGKFASSLTHCERALALYDPARHSEFLPTGSHTGIPALGYAAWNLWCLGSPDSALARAEEAVALGRRLNHPFSLARALFFESAIHRYRRDSARQQERAAEVLALSEMQEFPLFLGLGRYNAATGLPEMLEALTLIRETGDQSSEPAMLTFLAETQQAAGQLAEARATVAAALAISAQLAQPFWDADLQRLDGDLILATGGAPEEAAARYQQALDIARAQDAKSFELRAATSLARLWRDKGKRAEARDLLVPALRVVHRRLRHRRPERRQGSARGTGGIDGDALPQVQQRQSGGRLILRGMRSEVGVDLPSLQSIGRSGGAILQEMWHRDWLRNRRCLDDRFLDPVANQGRRRCRCVRRNRGRAQGSPRYSPTSRARRSWSRTSTRRKLARSSTPRSS